MPVYLKVVFVVISILCIAFILTRIGLFSGARLGNLGVTSGKLAMCPDTPNCVSTQALDVEHAIAPLHIFGSMEDDQNKLVELMEGFPRTNIIVNEVGYIYVEFRTGIMMYTDDVEFWFDEHAGYIHFRSASRLGTSDLGLNRRRMEQIRKSWMQVH